MSSSFSTVYPSWLVKPQVLQNVINNPFVSLKDVSTSVHVPESSLFMSGLRQALYWRRQLASSVTSHTVIFSFLGVGGLTLPNILEVCKALKNVCNMSKLVEVYRAPNSPFIGISFSDSIQADIFQSLCSFNDSFIIHVSTSSAFIHHFRLLGLPPLFPDDRIHHFLAKHSQHHHFVRDLIATDDHISTPSNSVSGSFQLSPQQDINTMPHLIPLPAPHLGSALLIISGRQSLCLKCGSLGHIRRSCPAIKCTSCHRFHLLSSTCSSASVIADSSLISTWMLEDTSSLLKDLHAPIIAVSLPECDHTHDASSPDELSSPVLSLSSASTLLSEPVTLDHIDSSAPPVKCLSSSSAHHSVTDHVFSKVKHHHKKLSSHIQVTSDPMPVSSLIPPIIAPSVNIYELLTDNVSLVNEDSSKPMPDKINDLPTISPSSSVPSRETSSRCSTLHSSTKRAKLSSSVAAFLLPPVSSWADQAEMELKETAASSLIIPLSELSSIGTSTPAPPLSEALLDHNNDNPCLSSTLLSEPASLTAIKLSSTMPDNLEIPLHDIPIIAAEELLSLSDQEVVCAPITSNSYEGPKVPTSSSSHSSASHPFDTVSEGSDQSSSDSSTSPNTPFCTSTYNLMNIRPHPTAKKSTCHTSCHHCHHSVTMPWPIPCGFVCTHCKTKLTVRRSNHFIPNPSTHPVYLTISRKLRTNSIHISYLQLCLDNKVRLLSAS